MPKSKFYKTKQKFGLDHEEFEVGEIVDVAAKKPLKLVCGEEISSFPMAFQTYGKLNSKKDNAILVFHGLTGDQYAASKNPVTGKDGWWSDVVGKNKAIDTEKYFVICPNVLGGCMGSFGPKSINEKTGKPYGLDFPVITIRDMAAATKLLIDEFGIKQFFAVIGASMGGMLTLQWALSYPETVRVAIPIATALKHTAQNIAFNEIGRQAILSDPHFQNGKYFDTKKYPASGLGVARMIAHITYLSEARLEKKFGRNLQDRNDITYGFDADFQIESYLRYQGMSFINRFDPASYLYVTRAIDYFDLRKEYQNKSAFKNQSVSFCVISFSSDWLFPTEESKNIIRALAGSALASNSNISFVEIQTDKGHDAFLLKEKEFSETIKGFLMTSF